MKIFMLIVLFSTSVFARNLLKEELPEKGGPNLNLMQNNTKEQIPEDLSNEVSKNYQETEDDVYELNHLKYQKNKGIVNKNQKWDVLLKRLHDLNEPSKVFNPSSILRNMNEKYSAFDVAQYTFWTDDEEGVSKAVKELIDEGLMTRENAIEFLNDIRLGIDYLKILYGSKSSNVKNQSVQKSKEKLLDALRSNYKSKGTYEQTTKYDSNEEYEKSSALSQYKVIEEKINPTEETAKIFQENTVLQDINQDSEKPFCQSKELIFERKMEFLEKVIYHLSKVLFTQSLKNDFKESSIALQNFTKFLENEGKNGQVPQDLQKKVLDILLTSLSDTLEGNTGMGNKRSYINVTK